MDAGDDVTLPLPHACPATPDSVGCRRLLHARPGPPDAAGRAAGQRLLRRPALGKRLEHRTAAPAPGLADPGLAGAHSHHPPPARAAPAPGPGCPTRMRK